MHSATESVYSKILKEFLEKNRGRKTFLEHEVKGLLKEAGLSAPNGVFIRKGETISPQLLDRLTYPLAAKVSSSKIPSKSDVKGIRLGLMKEEEVRHALSELLLIEDAEGVLVEEMAPEGLEVIAGGIMDNQFGPVVMFGLGGIFVELFKDVAFGLAPLTREDAHWLVKQVKAHRLLGGYRGRPPVDLDSLIDIIVGLSEFMATGLLEEMDLNPVALYPRGAMILDAKMLGRSLP